MNRILLKVMSLALVFSSCNTNEPEVIRLSKGWKFKTGDNTAWAKPDLDDSGWDSINVSSIWESQDNNFYDGYAWYRVKFRLPSSLKGNPFFNDTLQFIIGRVDDTEQTFLNGELIGQNGKNMPAGRDSLPPFEGDRNAYSYFRRYALPVNDPRIKWDDLNFLAIRVNDHGGGGGLYGSTPEVRMLDLRDYLKIEPFHVSPVKSVNNRYSRTIGFSNISSSLDFRGTCRIKVYCPENGAVSLDTSFSGILNRNSVFSANFCFDAFPGRETIIEYSFTDSLSGMKITGRQEVPYILTPLPDDKPRINGPRVVGAGRGHEIIFRIPVTGSRPLRYSADSLPDGLSLDTINGIIRGVVNNPGEYIVRVNVVNKNGACSRDLKVVVGGRIALTPPMGWNSWNCWGLSVDAEKVMKCANLMISSGLADHGWSYINIDDGWEAGRDANGEILANNKFPDMKGLCDSIHALGLKTGIYSSPGPLTCGGYTGSHNHEFRDARTYARWGFDYLKYDWCSYDKVTKNYGRSELKKPYILMKKAIESVSRDIVYSLCQYGMGNVWEWGDSVGGSSWRTTGDITDTWESLSMIGFNQDVCAPFTRPGNWNDPDMLVVGWVGWGPNTRPTRLTPSEQYTHVSLWALLSSPLLLGCDLSLLNDFTINLLTNDEVLEINQDPLGKPAKRVISNPGYQVWSKDLEDGSIAIGIFNIDDAGIEVKIAFPDLGLEGKYSVRDAWRQKEMGMMSGTIQARIPRHGAALYKFSRAGI